MSRKKILYLFAFLVWVGITAILVVWANQWWGLGFAATSLVTALILAPIIRKKKLDK